MKKINVKNIIFTYSCIRYNISIKNKLISVLKEISRKINVIIIDDSVHSDSIKIINFLELNDSRNSIIICNFDNNCWNIFDLENNNKFILNGKFTSLFSKRFCLDKKINKRNTIFIGARNSHIRFKKEWLLYFHVGSQDIIKKKTPNFIPLTEQYEYGLSNILSYFLSINFQDYIFDYTDIIKFVSNSRKFFRNKDASNILMKKFYNISQDLKNKFNKEIIAIFGTGFPFYMLDHNGKFLENIKTPESILSYFDQQFEYFKSKLISKKLFTCNKHKNLSIKKMNKEFNINVQMNKFDIYKYEKMNYKTPLKVTRSSKVVKYYENNCFDIRSNIWPCFYCSKLQNEDFFPDQKISKNTNITCLSCNQTSLKLRNVMSCTADVDVVLVVKENKEYLAKEIRNYILNESNFFIYESDFHKILIDSESPVDIFVADIADLKNSFPLLLKSNWYSVTFNSIVLWIPNMEYQALLGLCFPIAFEPIFVNDDLFLEQFLFARKKFAEQNSLSDVINRLKTSSFYTEQLMSNNDIILLLKNKLEIWRDYNI